MASVSDFSTSIDLQQVIKPTTLLQSDMLDEAAGVKVLLASETFQHTGSFKFRAALSAAQSVPQKKLIAASSGNFGQALAYACRLLQKTCIIVMPAAAARVKIDAVQRFGGRVELVDTSVKTRAQRVAELHAEDPDAAVLSAYDDQAVIAGNATLGKELAAISDRFDAVIVPVGGGGLLSGIIQGLHANDCRTPVWGVEPELANDAARSLRGGKIIRNDNEPPTIADGVRTLALGASNWPIIRDHAAGIIEVTEAEIVQALRLLFVCANLKTEPTGALSLAGAIKAKEQFKDQRVCCIVSGGNVDLSVLTALLAD